MKTWHYNLPNDRPGEGWAKITLSENGMFSAVSDWGNYAFLWTHTGYKDVREFFLSAERDWQYFAKKLRPDMIVNEEQSFSALRQELLRRRRVKDITKDEAQDVWAALDLHDCWNSFLTDQDVQEAFQEPWGYTVREFHPDVVAFCKRVMPRLAEVLQKELQEGECAHEIVLSRCKGFHTTRQQLEAISKSLSLDLSEQQVQESCDVRGERVYPHQVPWRVTRKTIERVLEGLKGFEGEADLVVMWGKNDREGFRISHHRLTRHSVELLLVQ